MNLVVNYWSYESQYSLLELLELIEYGIHLTVVTDKTSYDGNIPDVDATLDKMIIYGDDANLLLYPFEDATVRINYADVGLFQVEGKNFAMKIYK